VSREEARLGHGNSPNGPRPQHNSKHNSCRAMPKAPRPTFLVAAVAGSSYRQAGGVRGTRKARPHLRSTGVGKQSLGSSDYDGPMPLFDRSVTPPPIVERRRKRSRRRVLKGAQITFAHRTAAIDCVVRDLSDGGACLKVFSPIGIPDTFELRLDSASVRCCRVIWRKASQIGVEFI
jgi:hypothetical protein